MFYKNTNNCFFFDEDSYFSLFFLRKVHVPSSVAYSAYTDFWDKVVKFTSARSKATVFFDKFALLKNLFRN